jgi:hypothetical protein
MHTPVRFWAQSLALGRAESSTADGQTYSLPSSLIVAFAYEPQLFLAISNGGANQSLTIIG